MRNLIRAPCSPSRFSRCLDAMVRCRKNPAGFDSITLADATHQKHHCHGAVALILLLSITDSLILFIVSICTTDVLPVEGGISAQFSRKKIPSAVSFTLISHLPETDKKELPHAKRRSQAKAEDHGCACRNRRSWHSWHFSLNFPFLPPIPSFRMSAIAAMQVRLSKPLHIYVQTSHSLSSTLNCHLE